MRLGNVAGGVVLGGMLAFAAGQALSRAQEDRPNAREQPTQEQMAAMQAEWAKMAAPSVHHKHLEYFVGKWKTQTKMWMGGPGSNPMESKGTSEAKWVLGRRFLLDHHKGTLMGRPHEGMGLTGYDNYRNMYVASWCSNTATHMLTMTGTRDPSGTFTYFGEMDEPGMKVTGRMVKYVTRIINENKYVFEIYDLHAGDDYKVVEVTYSRM